MVVVGFCKDPSSFEWKTHRIAMDGYTTFDDGSRAHSTSVETIHLSRHSLSILFTVNVVRRTAPSSHCPVPDFCSRKTSAEVSLTVIEKVKPPR